MNVEYHDESLSASHEIHARNNKLGESPASSEARRLDTSLRHEGARFSASWLPSRCAMRFTLSLGLIIVIGQGTGGTSPQYKRQ